MEINESSNNISITKDFSMFDYEKLENEYEKCLNYENPFENIKILLEKFGYYFDE